MMKEVVNTLSNTYSEEFIQIIKERYFFPKHKTYPSVPMLKVEFHLKFSDREIWLIPNTAILEAHFSHFNEFVQKKTKPKTISV